MPRFVILEHDHPHGLHYDFMLEAGPVLKTWSLLEPPESKREQTATLLPDHRLAYLDYEGSVSNQRGTVKKWDQGTYRILKQSETLWTLEISGSLIRGIVSLVRNPMNSDEWTILFS